MSQQEHSKSKESTWMVNLTQQDQGESKEGIWLVSMSQQDQDESKGTWLLNLSFWLLTHLKKNKKTVIITLGWIRS